MSLFAKKWVRIIAFAVSAVFGAVVLTAGIVAAATTISTNIQTDGTLSVTGTSTLMGSVGIGTTSPSSVLTVWGPDTSANTLPFLVANSASTSLVAVTDGGKVGIGTTTPADNLVVSNSLTTATLGLISAGDSVGSGNVRFDMYNGDGNDYDWQFGGSGNTLLKLQYGGTHDVFNSNGSLVLGYSGGAANMFDVVGGASIGGASSPYGNAPTNGLIVAGNTGIGTTTPWGRLSVTGPDTAATSPAFVAADSNNKPLFAIFDSGSVGIGTTTPVANFQVANGSNATTTMELGSAGQNKGSCLKLYRTDGSAIYAYVAAGATTFTLTTTACANVSNF
jgi:hypothetical protein